MVTKITTTKDLRNKTVFNVLILLVFGLILITNSLNKTIDFDFFYNNILFMVFMLYALTSIVLIFIKSRMMQNGVYADTEINKLTKTISFKNGKKSYSFDEIESYIRDEKRGVTGFFVGNKVYVFNDEELDDGKQLMGDIFNEETLKLKPFSNKFNHGSWIAIMYVVIFVALFVYIIVAGLALRTFFFDNLYVVYSLLASIFITLYVSVILRLRLFQKNSKGKVI